MKFTDQWGRRWTLTHIQAHYLAEADKRQLEYGWGGFRSTLVVRLLEERGLITLQRGTSPAPSWTITGLTRRGAEVLAKWRRRKEAA